MTHIQITCANQQLLIATTPTTRAYQNSLKYAEPIIIDPEVATCCNHYDDSCETCVLHECNTCLDYHSVLNFLTTNFPDQFENYPELLL